MRRTVPTALALCLSLVMAAHAETAAAPSATGHGQPAPSQQEPGAVRQFMAAQDLFALGRAQNDPAAVLAAARLAARIVPDDTDRIPDPPAEALPPSHPDAATMFTAAKALAASDDAMTDLIAQSEAEATRLPARTLLRTTRGIAAGGTQTYRLAVFGAATAEIGLLGDGKADLDLSVTLADETVCLDRSPTDRALCAFVPAENTQATVTITNRSETVASYSLLSN